MSPPLGPCCTTARKASLPEPISVAASRAFDTLTTTADPSRAGWMSVWSRSDSSAAPRRCDRFHRRIV